MYDIAIIGGGFAGIYSAWQCARAGLKVLLVDQADHLGGTLYSVEKLGYLVDIGAHHLDLRTPRDAEFYGDILGENLAIIENHGWASTTGKAFTHGLELPDFSTSDLSLCAKALGELAQVRPSDAQPEALPDWLTWKFGPTLATRLEALVAKIIGGPASGLDRTAASSLGMISRVKLGSDAEMAELKGGSGTLNDRLAVSLACRDERFLGKSSTLRFGYPAHGALRALCHAAAVRLKDLTVDVCLGMSVQGISPDQDFVGLRLSGSDVRAHRVLWTLPDNSLLRMLGLETDVAKAAWPIGAAIHVFEVQNDDILGPSYVHDFSLDRASYRYSRPGTYSRQVKPDGHTFVLAEIPCHPAKADEAAGMKDMAWHDLVASGYLRAGTTYRDHAVMRYPVAYTLPRIGWQSIVRTAEDALSAKDTRIIGIPFGHRGRDSFMTYFDNQLLPNLLDQDKSLGSIS